MDSPSQDGADEREPTARLASSRWRRLLRHRWHEDSARAVVGSKALARLERLVERSERFHSGEIRVCVEGGLPWSYLWRRALPRERALALFGKLGVWDTEQNNGVLIYLLVADRAIEIVADRGLSRCVAPERWDAVLATLAPALKAGHFDEGLAAAIQAVDRLLQDHFPLPADHAPGARIDVLPNRPVVL